jgi:hypothetical protein
MKFDCKMMLCLSSFGLLFSQVAQAQVCEITNTALNGPYGYIASELGTVVTTSPPPGTTGTAASNYSGANIGQLLAAMAAGNQFGLAGVLIFDGAGNIRATSAPIGTVVAYVGTYNVNADCSISVSLTDVFGTNASPGLLAGIVLGHGAEIDLVSASSLQAQAATGTSHSTGSGLAIKLVKVLYQNGCLTSSLKGLYAFVLNPIAATAPVATVTASTNSSQPSSTMGYLDFDGAGNIIPLPTMGLPGTISTTPSFATLAFTGSYAVNLDCSATMTISNSGTAPTAGAGTMNTSSGSPSITVNFVITPSQGASGFPQSPGLSLSFYTADGAGSGYAVAQ